MTCTDDKFRCGDDTCINGRWRCDGDYDCEDLSDELECREYLEIVINIGFYNNLNNNYN